MPQLWKLWRSSEPAQEVACHKLERCVERNLDIEGSMWRSSFFWIPAVAAAASSLLYTVHCAQ